MTKKPTKKAATKKPAKKLIEGKYSHKFFTRLEPSEGDKLQEIMKRKNIKSWATASVLAIVHYNEFEDRIAELESQVDQLENDKANMLDAVNDFKSAYKKLGELDTDNSNDDEETCEGCYEDFPSSHLKKVNG
ncbi:MAG TPA: hypothetical protein VEA37_10725, partial [Flavobacterium sp.]|nr:hypothetical protein [Flavobacterium sp.]